MILPFVKCVEIKLENTTTMGDMSVSLAELSSEGSLGNFVLCLKAKSKIKVSYPKVKITTYNFMDHHYLASTFPLLIFGSDRSPMCQDVCPSVRP